MSMRCAAVLGLVLGALFGCDGAPAVGDGGEDLASASGDGAANVDLAGDASSDGGPMGACIEAELLWFDDFETGDYLRWSSNTYDDEWDDSYCHSNDFSTDHAVSGTHSHRSEVTCQARQESHRGYGGVQFSGDSPMADYTNMGVGIDAPFGVVNTYYSWLEAPDGFGGGRWFSPFTSQAACDWSMEVLTVGLEDAARRLTPAHVINTGGTVLFKPNAPSFPLGQWVRTTLYLNYHSGEMRLWQDGAPVFEAHFTRPSDKICQWHWGLYASGDNSDLVLYEDDNYLWKLRVALSDLDTEPWIGHARSPCP